MSQDTLTQENTVLYSEEYILHPDGTFTYDYGHCTGSDWGKGTYTRTEKKIEFNFEWFIIPQDSVYCENDPTTDTLAITLYNYGNPDAFPYFNIYHDSLVAVNVGTDNCPAWVNNQLDTARVGFWGLVSVEIYPKSEGCNVYRIYAGPFMVSAYTGPRKVIMKQQKSGKYLYKMPRPIYTMREGKPKKNIVKVIYS